MNSGLFFLLLLKQCNDSFFLFLFSLVDCLVMIFFISISLATKKRHFNKPKPDFFYIQNSHTHTHASHSFFRFHFQNVFIIFRGYGFFSRLLFYHYRRCVAIVFVFTILSHIFYILTKLNFNLKSHYSTTTTVMMMTWKQKPGIIFFLSLKQTPFHSKL